MPHLLGETIPIRLFLGGFDLTPTFRDVNKKFSTRYYLNLVLIDEENRRYFKQQVKSNLRWKVVRLNLLSRKLLYSGYQRCVRIDLSSRVLFTHNFSSQN
jgi:hypothetical protein